MGPSVITGMAIFVLTVGASLFIAQSTLQPGGSFDRQSEAAAWDAYDTFQVETGWTIHRQPVMLRTAEPLSDYPIDIAVPFPRAAQAHSVLVMHNGAEISSDHNVSGNRTVFVSDLAPGLNRFEVIYTTEGGLSDRTYTNGLSSSPTAVWHDALNVSTAASGLSQVTFNGTDLFAGTAAMNGGGSPAISAETVGANISYGDRWARVYNDSEHIWVRRASSGAEQWVFNLSATFSDLYVDGDGTYDLDDNGTIFTGTADAIDVSDTVGLMISSAGMDVNVTRSTDTSPVIANLTIRDPETALIAHTGNHTRVTAELATYPSGVALTRGIPDGLTGISAAKAASLEAAGEDTIAAELGLTDTDYNLSVGDIFDAGSQVRGDTVVSFSFQTAVVSRFANATIKPFDIRVWQ